ncbi:prion-like-(Q/N-rich) domain-bearing protein 25 isoform X2 [Neodiprion fabricii]|uniref:prion-like-(Q/N-rich) domain-bearing protein 25 isoform X2 n=1 Tax=Neodiprion fabricii TaxID=2872261 RepID=UPI001ED92149|nr:prion-like-(Q/N-rich) domain-bearing protein 25 isoform X2 [Neodiprion fabricii]
MTRPRSTESIIIITIINVIFARSFNAVVCVSMQPASLTERNLGEQKPKTLAACHYDSDCVENAYCLSQETCQCKEGYFVDRNRTHAQCLAIATKLGDPCIIDMQCQVTFAAQAECRDGVCGCSEASHFQGGRCFETKRIGQICQVTDNCHIEGSPSYCVTGICTCPFQHHPNENGTRCIRSSILGDECTVDEECVTMNSKCYDVCRCRVDHVISGDQKRCLKVANTVGEPCDEDSQCQEYVSHSECREGSCACETNYHQRGPVCMKSVELSGSCTSHQQCVTRTHKDSNSSEVTSVDCVDGICTCANNYMTTEDSLDCVRYSENGASTINSATQLLFILSIFQILHALFRERFCFKT